MRKTNTFKITGGLKAMSDQALKDSHARKKIINDLDTNFLVEAGAGSGKTSSLVKRITSLITNGKNKISEIAAITFTKKAASELMERLLNELEDRHNSETDPTIKENLYDAINNFDQCFTGTIHSFCSGILRERPVEAGVDPDFDEIDDSDEFGLITEVWNEFIKSTRAENPDMLKLTEKIGVSPEELQDSFVMLNKYPEIKIHAEKSEKPDLKPAVKKVLEICKEASKYIPDEEPDKGYDAFQKNVQSTLRLLEYRNLYEDKYAIEILTKFEKTPKITQNRWLDKKTAKNFQDVILPDLVENTVYPVLRKHREHIYTYFIDFFQDALTYYENKRNQESILNYNDLLTLTSKMLRNNSKVREYFQNKYKTTLVDEFQDTDPIQAEIIMYLTGEDLKETDWSKLRPKKGSLFVVGDPKQSIYRFRRADIDIYNFVKEIISQTGGEILELTSNFRSLNSIADYLNPVFEERFPESGDRYQAPMAKIRAIRENNYEHGVKKILVQCDSRKKEDVVEIDAENIARYIKYAVDGGIKLARNEEEKSKGLNEKPVYSDFLIITKHKDLLEQYANTLEKYGIPSTVTGDDFFSQSEEINHIYKLLKFLSKPDDEILLVSVLRGMFFGLSDNDLYQFKASNGYLNIFSSIPESLDENIKNLFNNCFSTLRKYKKIINELPPSSALETIFQDLGILPYTSLKNLSKSRAANIYFLIEQVKQKETTEFYSFGNVVNHIGRLLESKFEQRNSLEVESNCVRIMNLHKAKGLEAPVVFLAHPHKNTKHDPTQHINRREGEPIGYFALTKKKGIHHKKIFAQPKNWEEFQEEEQKFLDAEFERLVYVAATRAKNLLIISCKEKGNGSQNPWLSLLGNLKDDDVIDVPDVSIEHDSGVNELSVKDINDKKAEISHWRHSVSEENYSNMTPTEVKDLEKIFAGERLEGGGQDWGTAVHNFLEFAVMTKDTGYEDLDTYIKFTFEELDISSDRTEEAKKIIEDFKQTDLFNRIKNAEQVETEAPISMKINPESEIMNLFNTKTSNKPIILAGVIDLVFKEKDGWVIIDYKTDRVNSEEEYEKLRQAYLNQVEIYAKAWEEITGEKVKEKNIYFV